MDYWLFVTTVENWKVISEKNFIGLPRRNESALSRVNVGDKCLIYIKQRREEGKNEEPVVIGEYQITSEVYVENTRVFDNPKQIRPQELFPLRMKLKHVGRLGKPVPFKPIVPKLSFIANQKKWGSSLQGRGIINIPKKDYLTIVSFLKAKSGRLA